MDFEEAFLSLSEFPERCTVISCSREMPYPVHRLIMQHYNIYDSIVVEQNVVYILDILYGKAAQIIKTSADKWNS